MIIQNTFISECYNHASRSTRLDRFGAVRLEVNENELAGPEVDEQSFSVEAVLMKTNSLW